MRRFDTFLHEHDTFERPRDYMGVGNQRVVGRLQDNSTGLNTSEHTLVAIREDAVETGEPFIRVEVRVCVCVCVCVFVCVRFPRDVSRAARGHN